MHFANFQVRHSRAAVRPQFVRNVVTAAAALIATGVCLGLSAPSAHAETLTRSVTVPGTPSEIWASIGPFCAIKDWLPPVRSCTETDSSPSVRTLVTKDGQATFVERQVARNDQEHFYSYVFVSSPLPVSHYKSTIKVSALGRSQSTVTWSASYTPDMGRDVDAKDALRGIYAAGLTSIRQQATQRVAPAAVKRATS
jgi:hypothetical protein